jgi:hypothetical protein
MIAPAQDGPGGAATSRGGLEDGITAHATASRSGVGSGLAAMPRGRSSEAPGARQGRLLARKPAREANCWAETFDAWFARFLKTKECGASYRRITGNIVAKWVSPVIGTKPVRGLTRDDIEDVRDGSTARSTPRRSGTRRRATPGARSSEDSRRRMRQAIIAARDRESAPLRDPPAKARRVEAATMALSCRRRDPQIRPRDTQSKGVMK